MAQNKVKKLKTLENASKWCSIASLLVFFSNLIGLIAIVIIGTGVGNKFDWEGYLIALTIITESISLACILGWIVMAIMEMVMIKKYDELKKYHNGNFAAWIIAMIISISFLFLSLLIFFVGVANDWGENIAYYSFMLYLGATAGSIVYLASISRCLKRFNKVDATKTKAK